MKHILKCEACNKYLIKDKCDCGKKSTTPKPPKYSTEDLYAKYRRQAKEEGLKKEGLI